MDNLLLEKTIKEIEQLTPTQLNECYGVYDKIFRKLPIIACEPIEESLQFFRVRIADVTTQHPYRKLLVNKA